MAQKVKKFFGLLGRMKGIKGFMESRTTKKTGGGRRKWK
jgi:hypothetical protein